MERYADDRLRRRGVALPSPEEREATDALRTALDLKKKARAQKQACGPTFREAAELFVGEYQVITLASGTRSTSSRNHVT